MTSPICTHTFRDSEHVLFFDSASVGLVSEACERAARQAEHDVTGHTWAHHVSNVTSGIALNFDVDRDFVTLYHNTTAGVQRIFSRLGHVLGTTSPTLLTTDLEYPGIMALADETWMGRLVIAKVANLIWERKAHVIEDTLLRAFLTVRPAVLYISHVSRASGFQISPQFIQYIKTLNPNVVIIVDGAQASGNIEVPREFLNYSDFYVTSGHKWLGGRQTLGIVYAHPGWNLADPAQGYSLHAGSRGTGSIGALASLAASLEELNRRNSVKSEMTRPKEIADWNASLAKQFCSSLQAQGIPTVPICQIREDRWKWSGIVAVPNFPLFISNHLMTDYRVRFQDIHSEPWRSRELGGRSRGPRFVATVSLPATASGDGVLGREPLPVAKEVYVKEVDLSAEVSSVPPGGYTRFCFHYYHTPHDVDRLSKLIAKACERVR